MNTNVTQLFNRDSVSSAVVEDAIRVEGLCVCYGKKRAFHDISFAAPRGQITALIGPSGCGKTSLLQCMNRLTDLVPGCCVTGRVLVDNIDVYAPQVDMIALRRHVGMLFQKPNPFPLSIRRNIELPLREHGMRKRAALNERIEYVLREVGLWEEVHDRLDSAAQSLSGGQQQRLCLARAIALEPNVLLMDEPCSALDPISSGVVEDLIARLRNKYTVLIVTHNLAQARRIADNTGFFWADDGIGRLVEYGPTEQIFERPQDARTQAYVEGRRG